MKTPQHTSKRRISQRPILVTGSHRSGTTWVGKILSSLPSIYYIHEPFNVDYPPNPGISAAKFSYWYTYISQDNAGQFYKPLENTMKLRYDLWSALGLVRSRHQLIAIWKEYRSLSRYRRRCARPLIKDPIAVFSAQWLASTFDMQVVTMIRHPAAFASSLKRLDWHFPFSHLLEQRSLMNDYFQPYEAQISDFARKQHDIIEQAALVWKLIHHVIGKYQANHPDWLFIRHEDLSRDPVKGFQAIFEKLNIEFSDEIKNTVWDHSHSGNPAEAAQGESHVIKRDSEANIWNWKNRLKESEINTIRASVQDVSDLFYSDDDW